MNHAEDDCAHHALLPEGQSTLFDSLPQFDEDLADDVTVGHLPLSAAPGAVDEGPGGSGSSLPATPAERPCTFCPASLPLPPATGPSRVTLVLDLDGTLIASEELNAANSAYLWNPHGGVRDPDYEAMGRRVWLRPGVREFLAAVRPHFEIVLFTAATQNWAAAAIEHLDPSAYLFDVMLHRDHTTSDMMWDYVKDLSRLGRDLARVVIVDDNPLMFMYQPDNALHIGAYEAASAGGPDNVLERVSELLISKVAVAEDVREVLGPMARAKSCIVSTVNGKAAPDPAAELPAASCGAAAATEDTAAPAASTHGCPLAASAGLCDGADESGSCATAVPGAPNGDAMACDGVPAGGCGDDSAPPDSKSCGEDDDAQVAGEELSSEEELHAVGDGSGDAEEGAAGGLHCASGDAEAGALDLGAEAEVPEIFDEHGVPASLGAGDWQERCAAAESEAAAGSGVPAVGATGEDDDSGHEDDEFDALMEGAIAEYDSDAYDDGVPYDTECPAGTAAAAAVVAARGACLAPDEFASLQGCAEGEGCLCGCVLRTCAFGFGCTGMGGDHDIFGDGDLSVEVHTGVAACDESISLATCGEAAGRADAPAAEAVPRAPTPAFIAIGADFSSEGAAASAGESRQPPTGMVFLADLHPPLAAPTAASEASHGPAEGAEAPDATGVAPRPGSKRAREDGPDAACDGAVPHSRLRLDGGDVDATVLYAGVDLL